MDVFSVSVIAVTAAGVAACGALAWRAALTAPEGYEDAEGFHIGPTPAPVDILNGPVVPASVIAPVIDWTKPLEAVRDGKVHPVEYKFFNEGGLVPHRVAFDGWSNWHACDDGRVPGTHIVIRNRAEAPAVANDNLPKLTHEQARVLAEMHSEISYPAAKLASWTGLSEKAVTKARKELKALGLVEYGTLRGDGGESHEIAGRGYWLTKAGRKAQDALGVEGAA